MKVPNRNNLALAAIFIITAICLVYGWRLFWFLTDDAYISFRYVSNSILGYGYVWNPPPFRPVEGYTNFLWIVLLEAVWRILKIQPPESSTYISLFCSYLSLLVTTVFVMNMKLHDRLKPYRIVFVVIVLTGILTNRTFLAWTSSGLETALYNLLVILWVYYCMFTYQVQARRLAVISLITLSIGLTRPDGMLFAAILAGTHIMAWLYNRKLFKLKELTGLTPLLGIGIHILWRKNMYGEWLPNTYYAKINSIWPESGIKYFSSFALEYSLWFWAVPFMLLGVKKAHSYLTNTTPAKETAGQTEKSRINLLYKFIALSALSLHAAYYTLIVGGDYFEFRIYSVFIPLILVSLLYSINLLSLNVRTAIAIMVLYILFSWPIQWTGWNAARTNNSIPIGSHIYSQVGASLPRYLKWYGDIYDRQQNWLIDHFVCIRHQEHKNFYLYLKGVTPTRDNGQLLPANGFPVLAISSPGVFGWAMPRINIIDTLGLNDYVVARNPVNKSNIRLMAHEHTAPAGYIQCFSPNVEPGPMPGKPVVVLRTKPLTANDIQNCEHQWSLKVQATTQELL